MRQDDSYILAGSESDTLGRVVREIWGLSLAQATWNVTGWTSPAQCPHIKTKTYKKIQPPVHVCINTCLVSFYLNLHASFPDLLTLTYYLNTQPLCCHWVGANAQMYRTASTNRCFPYTRGMRPVGPALHRSPQHCQSDAAVNKAKYLNTIWSGRNFHEMLTQHWSRPAIV